MKTALLSLLTLNLALTAGAATIIPIRLSDEPVASIVNTNDDVILNATNSGTGTWTTKRATVQKVFNSVTGQVAAVATTIADARAAAAIAGQTTVTPTARGLANTNDQGRIIAAEIIGYQLAGARAPFRMLMMNDCCANANTATATTNYANYLKSSGLVAAGYNGWKTNSNWPVGLGPLIPWMRSNGIVNGQHIFAKSGMTDGTGVTQQPSTTFATIYKDAEFLVTNDCVAVWIDPSGFDTTPAGHEDWCNWMGRFTRALATNAAAYGKQPMFILSTYASQPRPTCFYSYCNGISSQQSDNPNPGPWYNSWHLELANGVARNSRPGFYPLMQAWNHGNSVYTFSAFTNASGYRAWFSLNCMASACLWPNGDANPLPDYAMLALTNAAALAIDSDPLAYPIQTLGTNAGGVVSYFKPLANGDVAICLLNTNQTTSQTGLVTFAELPTINSGVVSVKDIWSTNAPTLYTGSFAYTVGTNAANFYRLTPVTGAGATVTLVDQQTNTLRYVNGLLASVTPWTPPEVVTNGLAAYWKLNEGSGTSLADSGTNGNTATLAGSGTTWTTTSGRPGLKFNGSGYATVPASASINFTGAVSLCAFVTCTNTGSEFIFSAAGNGSPYYGYSLAQVGVNLGMFTGANWIDSGYTITNRGRIMVTVAASGTTNVFYVNTTAVKTNTGVNLGTLFSGQSCLSSASDGGTPRFTGILDNVRVYNRALTPQDISDIYTRYQ